MASLRSASLTVPAVLFVATFVAGDITGCNTDDPVGNGAGANASAGGSGGGVGGGTGGEGGNGECGTPAQCAELWEERTSTHYDTLVAGDPADLASFLHDVPKGGDLHNHLSGSVYAETFLDWAQEDGNCINTSTFRAVFANQCSSENLPAPSSGAFFDDIVRAWSMKDFVPSAAESGHDHFFATFGKFGLIAGFNRWESLADIAIRAADENQLYIETMFNLGRNVGDLSASLWSGTLTAADLPVLYDTILNDPSFNNVLSDDVDTVTESYTGYRNVLECAGDNPPAACDIEMRFMAQVSRTGGTDKVFGQLVSAFEMAKRTPLIVAANLSSPEDNPISLDNYTLHMEMLDFLYDKYTATNVSPLHITLHAGELTKEFLPDGSDADTFHIRQAVEIGHAERIGHGLAVLSRTNSAGLLADMANAGVLVETCLSSNIQILEVSGDDHPLAAYLRAGVPVALATDDQGVSRSSLAGEYQRAALAQGVSYRELKTMARNSLAYAFLPGESLWVSVTDTEPVAACTPDADGRIGEDPSTACDAFLAASEKARLQWELERRFLDFEQQW